MGRRYFATWTPQRELPAWLRFRRWLDGLADLDPTPPALEAVRLNAGPGTFHPLARRDNQPAVVEALSLGSWMAISGAAFSTGGGRASSPLQALFMGLCNLRLGYWWDSGIGATERPGRFPANVWRRIKELPGEVFRMQHLLFSEWTARFGGPSYEFWNLTDGGHLDNSALYELIRRRVDFIICVDATCDPDYSFESIADLMRCVSVDFGAEIEWQENPAGLILPDAVAGWVNLENVGAIEGLRGNPAQGGPGKKHAAIATIAYPTERSNGEASAGNEGKQSWLLLIKPSLTESDPSADVSQYAKAHPDFPQDSTADQIYDEAQWESYRKLGHKAADCVIKSRVL